MALKPDKTRVELGVSIHEKIIPWGARWTKGTWKRQLYKADKKLSLGTGKAAGVTIHNTGGDADAETYTRATWPNQNMKDARVHYYVDDKEAWQNLREDEVGWHAGDGSGPGNTTTLAVEIIMKGKAIKDDAKAEDNGARLAAALLHRHGLTIDKLYTHKDWSGKNCPLYILPHWRQFVSKVNGYLDELRVLDKAENKPGGAAKESQSAVIGTQYLANYTYKGSSIVDALKGIGIDSSYAYREKLARKNGIKDYRGTALQNISLLNMLKNGKLKRA
ncbi:MAG: N-acetylmuramoyl-L-alanine amidase [Christensenellales bacterium]